MHPPVTVHSDKGRSGLGWEKTKRETKLRKRFKYRNSLLYP